MKFTFNELLNKYQVSIPLIQRDYAQGRKTAGTIRKNFVAKLKKVLTAPLEDPGSRLHLDFVYGYTESDSSFIPLDGQQRLTTLFLLHWYIAVKEGLLLPAEQEDSLASQLKTVLHRFNYQTRLSSQRFCAKLVENPVLAIGANYSERIIDQSWFMSAWKNDPTILSMLNMLDAIHGSFRDTSGIWERLASPAAITFEFIDIKSEQFRLTDELYIKMNSRGKPLTDFENFKAEFIDLLKESDYQDVKLHYENTELSYKDYFSINIDGKWMDLFWDKRSVIHPDEGLINYLSYITELMFYNEQPEAETFVFEDAVKLVYKKQANALFLFQSLDMLAKLPDTHSFFSEVFSNTGTYVPERVGLFEKNSVDLFGRSLNGGTFDVRNRILLYALLYYQVKFNDERLDRLRDFIRIVRNLLTRVRQINSRKKIEFTSNLRLPDFSDYCQFIQGFAGALQQQPDQSVYEVFHQYSEGGFSKAVIQSEQQKTEFILLGTRHKSAIHQLEEHPDIQGITDNFDLGLDDLQPLVNNFYSIWHPDVYNSRIVRGMLTCGDYSVKTHSDSRLGDIWYLGARGNWGRILTTGSDKEQEYIRPILNSFLNKIGAISGTGADRLDILIKGYNGPRDYLWYFIKYYGMTASFADVFNTLNLFTWQDENGYDINSLGNSGQHPLASYHLNPYLLALKQELNNNKVELFYGRFSDSVSYLRLKGRALLFCRANGWHIQELYKDKITPELIAKYGLEANGKDYLLKESAALDRMEVALEFCKELLN